LRHVSTGEANTSAHSEDAQGAGRHGKMSAPSQERQLTGSQ
jgi:hypothetical protein